MKGVGIHRVFHISNIPIGTSQAAILRELKRVLRLEGHPCTENLGVRILPLSEAPFSAGATQQWAIIYNALLGARDMDIIKMKKITLEHNGNRRSVVLHSDTLMEYGPTWQSEVTMSPREIRNLNSQLFGEHHRKITGVFKTHFLQKVNLDVWDANSNSVRLDVTGHGYIDRRRSTWDARFSRGSTNYIEFSFQVSDGNKRWIQCRDQQKPESIMVTYGTSMDCLQAIRKLNGNADVLGAPYQFIPLAGRARIKSRRHANYRNVKSTCKDFAYLGNDGQQLNILEIVREKGYLPEEMFDKRIIQFRDLSYAMERELGTPTCVTCNSTYTIKGVSCDFGWLAATCKCSYSCNVERDASCDPVRWYGELFTRLILFKETSKWNAPCNDIVRYLTVNFQPAQLMYESPIAFSSIQNQMFRNEVHYRNALLYKEAIRNTSDVAWEQDDFYLGPVLEHVGLDEEEYVEELNAIEKEEELNKKIKLNLELQVCATKAANMRGCYLKILRIPMYHFSLGILPRVWVPSESALSHVILRCEGQADRIAEVVHMQEDSQTSILKIKVRYTWNQDDHPTLATPVHTIIPALNPNIFRQSLNITNKFLETNSYCVKLFLGQSPSKPYKPHIELSWSPSAQCEMRRFEALEEMSLALTLNEQQMTAISTSLSNSFAVIDGMPGCGKSTTAAILALRILVTNPGKVMLLCSNDQAADSLSVRIQNWINKIPAIARCMALRVYSHSVQTRLAAVDEPKLGFYTLHQEVRKTTLLDNFRRKCGNADKSRFAIGTEAELFVEHFERVAERSVCRQVDVVISTISAAQENRLSNFVNQLSTVIVEETEQIPQCFLMAVFQFNAPRYVFFGDRKMHTISVQHPGCKLSGFNINLLERAAHVNRICRISGEPQRFPYIKLHQQFRMDSDISQFISESFYFRKLEDSNFIVTRDRPGYISKIASAIPLFSESRILLVSVSGNECDRKDGYGPYNAKEASKAVSLIKVLLSSEVPAACIGVVTACAAQKRQISKNICRVLSHKADDIKVKIATETHGYEADIIIYSSVRTASVLTNIDLERDETNLRLALSRARFGCFFLCDPEVIKRVESKVNVSIRNLLLRRERVVNLRDS